MIKIKWSGPLGYAESSRTYKAYESDNIRNPNDRNIPLYIIEWHERYKSTGEPWTIMINGSYHNFPFKTLSETKRFASAHLNAWSTGLYRELRNADRLRDAGWVIK